MAAFLNIARLPDVPISLHSSARQLKFLGVTFSSTSLLSVALFTGFSCAQAKIQVRKRAFEISCALHLYRQLLTYCCFAFILKLFNWFDLHFSFVYNSSISVAGSYSDD